MIGRHDDEIGGAAAGMPAFRCGLDGSGGLSGSCYRKLARLVPGLEDLVDCVPGHSRLCRAPGGTQLSLVLLAVGHCGSSVDLALRREYAGSVRNRDAQVELELRAHCLPGFGHVEVLALSRGRRWHRVEDCCKGRGVCREAVDEALWRFLAHWLGRALDEGHRLAAAS